MQYDKELKIQIRQISDDFEKLKRREDVDYYPQNQHPSLNLEQLLAFWKYRVQVFSSSNPKLKASIGNAQKTIPILQEILEVLNKLLDRIPSNESADTYLNNLIEKLNESQPSSPHHGQQPRSSRSLLDRFHDSYWKLVPDEFKMKEIVRETVKLKSKTILSASADLIEAYCKSESKVKESFCKMTVVCIAGIVLLGVVMYIGAEFFDQPLGFQATFPINLLILLYCSVMIRRYLIDAKNRDVCKIRLREYNSLPDYDNADDQTKSEIIKNWYNSFNKFPEKDLTWSDVLKPLFARLMNT